MSNQKDFERKRDFLACGDGVVCNHTADGITYMLNPKIYFKFDVLEQERLTYETADVEKGKLDGTKSKKKIKIIYAVDNNKGHTYYNTYNELYPLQNGTKKYCVNCYKPIIERKNESKNYSKRYACVSCDADIGREHKKPIEKCGWNC
jgi:predicted RNA-binding Zn-ribbon protein involved in translation (DUF1610 family)